MPYKVRRWFHWWTAPHGAPAAQPTTVTSSSQTAPPPLPPTRRQAETDANITEGKRVRIAGIQSYSVDEPDEEMWKDIEVTDEVETFDPVMLNAGIDKAIARMVEFKVGLGRLGDLRGVNRSEPVKALTGPDPLIGLTSPVMSSA